MSLKHRKKPKPQIINQFGNKKRGKSRGGATQLKRRHPEPPYDAWERGELKESDKQLKVMQDQLPDEVWLNSRYQVLIYRDQIAKDGWPPMHWLSIKRRDKNVIRDWRDLQQIKNDLIGEEHEGVEVFPAESRLVDTANQYHVYVLADPNHRLPFGFQYRLVSEDTAVNPSGQKSKQRPFPADRKPEDLKAGEEIDAMVAEVIGEKEKELAVTGAEVIAGQQERLGNYSEDAIMYAIAAHLFRVLQFQGVEGKEAEPLRLWISATTKRMIEIGDPVPNGQDSEQIYHAANALSTYYKYADGDYDDDYEKLRMYWPPVGMQDTQEIIDMFNETTHPPGIRFIGESEDQGESAPKQE